MAKKKKWKKRNRCKTVNQKQRNRHHLLFQGRHWTSPYAKQLRQHTVREIPVSIHNELHNHIIHDIPKPSEDILATAWKDYQKNADYIDSLNICQLILWLYDEIPDEAFRACMMVQYRFFDSKITGG